MNLNSFRKYTDIVLFFLICFLLGTGLLNHYRLLPGYLGGHGLTFLGLSRHEWGDYHLWAAYLLTALVIFHIAINFAFVKNIIVSKKTWLMILLALAGSLIVLLFLFVPIEHSQGGNLDERQGRGRGRGANGEGSYQAVPGVEERQGEIESEPDGRGPGRGRGRGRGRGLGPLDPEE